MLKVICLLDRLPPSWNITDLAEAIIWENRCCFNVINLKWNRKKWHCPNVFGAKIQEYFATSFWDGIYSFVEITALARGWWTTQEEESGIWRKKSPPPCFFTPALSYFSLVFVMEHNWQLKYPKNRSHQLSRPINFCTSHFAYLITRGALWLKIFTPVMTNYLKHRVQNELEGVGILSRMSIMQVGPHSFCHERLEYCSSLSFFLWILCKSFVGKCVRQWKLHVQSSR